MGNVVERLLAARVARSVPRRNSRASRRLQHVVVVPEYGGGVVAVDAPWLRRQPWGHIASRLRDWLVREVPLDEVGRVHGLE